MLSFPSTWIHGSANCSTNVDPPFQTHAADANTFILRQNKCHNFEGPFLYLLLGTEKALLLDTGANPGTGHASPIRSVIDGLLPPSLHLIVAHSHSHNDHAFGDSQFAGRAKTTIVQPTLSAVTKFFALENWPDDIATYDLGNRPLTIVPAPGHEPTHIAVYDEQTETLLTGDTIYPGLLVINDWPGYRATAKRLGQFADENVVTHLLGAHIEMKQSPGELYPIGTKHQPHEHVLQLDRSHLTEWSDAVAALGNSPHQIVLDDFILDPR